MGWTIAILIGLVAVDLTIRLTFVPLVKRIMEKVPSFRITPAEPVPGVESRTVRSADGVELQVSYFLPEGKPRGVIVFCPELSGNRWMAPIYCQGLIDHGYAIAALDFRNQGDSQHVEGYEPLHWLTYADLSDVQAVIAAVRADDQLGDLPLGVFGVSRGGTAALAAAALDPDVVGVCSDSGFSIGSMMTYYTHRWAALYVHPFMLWPYAGKRAALTLFATRVLSQWQRGVKYVRLESLLDRLSDRPVLLINGDLDTYVPTDLAIGMSRQIGDSATCWAVPKAKHNLARAADPEQYDRRICSFWDQAAPAADARQAEPTQVATSST